MADNLTTKIFKDHLLKGALRPGEENAFKIDQILLQDATGTMAMLQFLELEKESIAPPFGIIYVDHNMIQLDNRNPEDHLFLLTCAAKFGLHFSRPGNGICHQVHLERFAKPGALMIGADSHTPMAGAVGCIAIGAGGMDVAVVMGGEPFELETQKVVGVRLKGKLGPWVSSKDVILEMLRRLTVKGGVGKVFEFIGDGVQTLTATQRGTIANMITELGATSAVFPADARVKEFLALQERPQDYRELLPDPGCSYDEEMEIDLSRIVPLIAKPHSPDNVVPVEEVAGLEVAQVSVGSSVNSSYEDLAIMAKILEGKRVPPTLNLTVSPGSRQVLDTAVRTGVLAAYLNAGARILEPACGPCVGMGQAPPSKRPSIRTFNRNFPGRSGTVDDEVYLCSPATAGATALEGAITDPRDLGDPPRIEIPKPVIDDSLIIKPLPAADRPKVQIAFGPNIKPPPKNTPLPDTLSGEVLIKLGDNISTGAMAPDGAIVMADRSNVGAIAEYTFKKEDSGFVQRAKDKKGGFILAGQNYGQGSSREHAALAPLHLGVRVVLAKGFARIHRRNLISQGMLPVLIVDDIYQALQQGSQVTLENVRKTVESGSSELSLKGDSPQKGTIPATFTAKLELNPRERRILLAGGFLNYLKSGGQKEARAHV